MDLFHGQLKSQVKCKTCGHISARFDPFNFLSLPLPMDSYMHLEITGEEAAWTILIFRCDFWEAKAEQVSCCAEFVVIKLEGSTPVRYGLRLNMDEKYMGLKRQLSELCSLKPEQILLTEVHTSNIKVQTQSKKHHQRHAQKHLSTAHLSFVSYENNLNLSSSFENQKHS